MQDYIETPLNAKELIWRADQIAMTEPNDSVEIQRGILLTLIAIARLMYAQTD